MRPEQPEATSLSFSEAKITLDNGEYTYRQNLEVKSTKAANLLYAYKLSTMKAQALPGFETDSEGWLLMKDSGIWTSDPQLSLDFTSQDGVIQDLITAVQVKVKHPDGTVVVLESPFKSSRVIGTLIEAPFSNGAETSAGIELRMRESIGDIYVDGMYAHHFMYRLNILDASLQVLQTGSWHSSINNPDIRRALPISTPLAASPWMHPLS
ncbi:MAG TPA: hypothetical protein PKI59_02220, partial [Candidatus Cloacimonadota bacterium]|nr:hypothetical protein [Candidatus Cloacimonadota bacterium]